MKSKRNTPPAEYDYGWYGDSEEEPSGRSKIKRVDSDRRPKREPTNWKKAWDEHGDDFDERDEFFANTRPTR